MNRWEMYKTLELPYGASSDQLKAAYRRLAKKYHPDITHNSHSSDKLARIIEAYNALTMAGPVQSGGKKREYSSFHGTIKTERPSRNVDIFAMGKLLERGKTAGMRAYAARNLGMSGKKSAYAFLQKGFYDESPMVVRTVVEAAGNLKIQQCSSELRSVFQKGDTDIREAVLRSIHKIGLSDPFMDIVVMARKDKKRMIRQYAQDLFPGTMK